MNDDVFKKLDEDIKRGIEVAFEQVILHAKMYLPYLEQYNYNERLDFNQFRTMDHDNFGSEIIRYQK